MAKGRDDIITNKMEAIDLRRFAEATAERQRATCKMQKLDLLEVLWPQAEGSGPTTLPAPHLNAHVISRAPAVEPEILEVDAKPVLYVIETPVEMRERWEKWCRIRRELILCLAITFALVALFYIL